MTSSRIPDGELTTIRERTSLADVVEEFTKLKWSGRDAKKGYCPFHGDHAANFYVRVQSQLFHCFSCHETGDIFGFLMLAEKTDFDSAVVSAAARIGYRIHYQDDEPT